MIVYDFVSAQSAHRSSSSRFNRDLFVCAKCSYQYLSLLTIFKSTYAHASLALHVMSNLRLVRRKISALHSAECPVRHTPTRPSGRRPSNNLSDSTAINVRQEKKKSTPNLHKRVQQMTDHQHANESCRIEVQRISEERSAHDEGPDPTLG